MLITMDRLLIAVLALLGTGVFSVAAADPPTTPAASPAPAATSSSLGQPAASTAATTEAAKPAASATPDATAQAAAQSAEEKRLLAAGYKPEMRNGTKYWCRSEAELGSHLAGHKVCGTADQIKVASHESQDSVEQAQRRQINPSGH